MKRFLICIFCSLGCDRHAGRQYSPVSMSSPPSHFLSPCHCPTVESDCTLPVETMRHASSELQRNISPHPRQSNAITLHPLPILPPPHRPQTKMSRPLPPIPTPPPHSLQSPPASWPMALFQEWRKWSALFGVRFKVLYFSILEFCLFWLFCKGLTCQLLRLKPW